MSRVFPKLKFVGIGLWLGLLLNSTTLAQVDVDTLNQLWSNANEAFAKGDFKAACEAAKRVAEEIPFEPSSRVFLARCQARLDRREEALDSLAKAAHGGWEDADGLKQFPEFADLTATSAFREIVETMTQNREREFVLYAGDSVDPETAAPLVVLYHGRGELPQIQLHFWKAAADQLGCYILALKGTRRVGNVYAWETPGARKTWQIDGQAIMRTTQDKLDQVRKSHSVSQVLLAGFSQGGVAATEALCCPLNPAPVGAVVFAAAFPANEEEFSESGLNLPERPIMVHIGENDLWLDGNRFFVKRLKQNDCRIEYREWPDIGHEMPAEYAKVIVESVKQMLHGQIGQ